MRGASRAKRSLRTPPWGWRGMMAAFFSFVRVPGKKEEAVGLEDVRSGCHGEVRGNGGGQRWFRGRGRGWEVLKAGWDATLIMGTGDGRVGVPEVGAPAMFGARDTWGGWRRRLAYRGDCPVFTSLGKPTPLFGMYKVLLLVVLEIRRPARLGLIWLRIGLYRRRHQTEFTPGKLIRRSWAPPPCENGGTRRRGTSKYLPLQLHT